MTYQVPTLSIRKSNDDSQIGIVYNYFNDTIERYLEGKVSVFTFSVLDKNNHRELLQEGNSISFTYNDEDYHLTIVKKDEDEDVITITAWSLVLELNNETKAAYEGKNLTFAQYLDAFDGENILTLNINEVSDKKISNKWESQQSMLERLFSLATVFSAELEFNTILANDGSLKELQVNVYKKHDTSHQGLGEDRSHEVFYFGDTIRTVKKSTSIMNLFTAIRPVGKDGLNLQNYTMADIKDDNGDVLYTCKNGMIYAPQSREQFPSNLINKADKWTVYDWQTDYTTQASLAGNALAKLRTLSVPETTWTIEGNVEGKIGDTIAIQDNGYTPTLLLVARINTQKICMTNPATNETTFTNVEQEASQLSSELITQMQKLIAEKVPYIPSISTTNGITFKNGVGETTLASRVLRNGVDVTADLTIRWYRDGAWLATQRTITIEASSIPSTALYSFTALDTYGNTVATDEVTLSNIYDGVDGKDGADGVDGADGADGAQGIQGPKGADGKSSYTHLAYADSSDGRTNFSVLDANRKYVGMYVDTTSTDSTNPTDYKWSLIKGADGSQGIQGKTGADGRTPYFHTAWATNSTGTVGFSLTSSSGRSYLGTYTDYASADSTDPSKYTWTLVKGDKGDTGAKGAQGEAGPIGPDGKTSYLHTAWKMPNGDFSVSYPNENLWVNSDTRTAYLNTNTSGMQSAASQHRVMNSLIPVNGTKLVYTVYNTGNISTTNTNRVHFYKADKTTFISAVGVPALTGVNQTISFTVPSEAKYVYLGAITGNDTTGNSPDKVKIKFEWDTQSIYTPSPKDDYDNAYPSQRGEYSDFTLEDSTDPTKYTWTKYLGVSSYTHIAYATNSTGSEGFSTSDSSGKTYIGMYVDNKSTDSSTPSDYNWTLIKGADGAQGIQGQAGADGKTPYFHTAWAMSSDGRTGFSVSVSAGKYYIGTYTDYTATDSTDPNRYKWVELANAIGMHFAYAWSKDGTDRFTRYNVKNLLPSLDSTNDILKLKQTTWSPTTKDKHGNFVAYAGAWAGIVVNALTLVELGKTYTYSVLITNNTNKSLSYSCYSNNATVPNKSGIIVPANSSARIFNTFKVTTITQSDTYTRFETGDASSDGDDIRQSSPVFVEGDSVDYLSLPSVDYDNAIPRYIGRSLKDSTNPTDFTWEPNPERKPWTSYAQGLNGEGFSLMPYGENKLLGTSNTIKTAMTVNYDIPYGFSTVQNFLGKKITLQAYIDNAAYDARVHLWTNQGGTLFGSIVPKRTSGISYVTGIVNDTATDGNIAVSFNGQGTISTPAKLPYSSLKLELANTMGIPTPWTPNPNDADADGSNASALLQSIPKYIGYSALPSDNWGDYTWQMNPVWADANASIGLNTKVDSGEYGTTRDDIYEKIENRVTQKEADEIKEIAQKALDSYNAYVDPDSGQAVKDLKSLEDRLVGLVNNLGNRVAQWNFIDTWMRVGEEGLEVANNKSTTKILVKNDRISFIDSGTEVAYFSGQNFEIKRGVITQSIRMGSHKFESLGKDHTVLRWVK